MCLILILAVISMAGCESEGPMERVGEKIDEAVEDTGEALEDAGEAVEDAVEKVEDKIVENKD
jgi:hypothetical protein